jgi:hypothetical protein
MGRSEQEQLYHQLAEQERRRHENPLRYLKPHPKQRQFLDDPARRRFFVGGNRSGKTTCGWMEAIAHAYGYKFWEVDNLELIGDGRGGHDLPPRENIPIKHWIRNARGQVLDVPNTGFILTGLSARRGLGETIYAKFLEIWPESCKVHPYFMMGGVPASIQFTNGSRALCGSGEQQELSTEGVEISWAWVDEPIPQRIYGGLWRGLLRHGGRIWFTFTPMGAKAAWITHNFIIPHKAGLIKDVSVLTIFMSENPHLDPKNIEDFKNDPTFTEAERQARLYGKPEHLTSRVWSSFVHGKPYVVSPREPPGDWDRIMVVDPHTARPWAIIWAALDPLGNYVIYREWPEEDYSKLKSSEMTYREYAALIRHLEGKERIKWRVIDPNYGIQRRRNMGFVERSIKEEMGDYGIVFDERVDDNLERGIGAVADLLYVDPKRALSPDNCPGIIVEDHCLNTINSLLNFAYIESHNPLRKSEKVSEEWKDFADCVRYMAVYDRPDLGSSYSYLPGGSFYSEEDT